MHIPKVFWEFSSSRILVTEWIDGTTLTDPAELEKAKMNVVEIMTIVVNLFSFQIFQSGFVHGLGLFFWSCARLADPHPGNIMVRPMPNHPKKLQVCLLDHGLYVTESEHFRHQYCLFWKALCLLDTEQMTRICSDWGIRDLTLFASASMQRPFDPMEPVYLHSSTPTASTPPFTSSVSAAETYRRHVVSKDRIRSMLSETEKIPLELLFVGRNINLVRSNNKHLGSPVNRVTLMALASVKGLGSDWTFWKPSHSPKSQIRYPTTTLLREIVAARVNYFLFQFNLFLISCSYRATRYYQEMHRWITGRLGQGFEDIVDANMLSVFKKYYSVDLKDFSFDA